MTTTTGSARPRPPLWRDLRVLRVVAQLVAVAVTVTVVLVLWWNLTNNLARRGLSTDLDFLTQPLAVDIAGSDLSSGAPVWRGLLVGIKNTFALVVVGIPLLTVIGLLIGVGRLSTNWLVAKICTVYVEVFRNLPPLLIIIFVFNAVALQLPLLGSSWNPLGVVIVNNRFVAVPSFVAEPGIGWFWALVGAAALAAIGLWVWRTRRWERSGQPHHRVAWSLSLLALVATVSYIALGLPFGVSVPRLEGRALIGGFSGLASYFAVLAALALYTASHVAEIVRGSILAVPHGQSEAANALALSGFQRLRYVILPQASRTALPPTINQYLNYTKNTSLAIAIGYAEITRLVFQTIGNGHPAPQLIAILMLSYLVFTLVISLLVNLVNRRLQYATR